MTKSELKRERTMEKMRARIVRAEVARIKREEEIRQHADIIISIMTAIVLTLLTIVAFVVDSFGFAKIPAWVYVVGFAYLIIYLFIIMKKFK